MADLLQCKGAAGQDCAERGVTAHRWHAYQVIIAKVTCQHRVLSEVGAGCTLLLHLKHTMCYSARSLTSTCMKQVCVNLHASASHRRDPLLAPPTMPLFSFCKAVRVLTCACVPVTRINTVNALRKPHNIGGQPGQLYGCFRSPLRLVHRATRGALLLSVVYKAGTVWLCSLARDIANLDEAANARQTHRSVATQPLHTLVKDQIPRSGSTIIICLRSQPLTSSNTIQH